MVGILLLVTALAAAISGRWWTDAALGILALGALTSANSQAWLGRKPGKANGLRKRLLA